MEQSELYALPAALGIKLIAADAIHIRGAEFVRVYIPSIIVIPGLWVITAKTHVAPVTQIGFIAISTYSIVILYYYTIARDLHLYFRMRIFYVTISRILFNLHSNFTMFY